MTASKTAEPNTPIQEPETYTFVTPPPTSWWQAKFNLKLPSAVFLNDYQQNMGRDTVTRRKRHWDVVSPLVKPTSCVADELGNAGCDLVMFAFDWTRSGGRIIARPSDRLLAVFGLSLATYDIVTRMDANITDQLALEKEVTGALTLEEAQALKMWISRGGLTRVRNPERLCSLLETSQARHIILRSVNAMLQVRFRQAAIRLDPWLLL